jgi:hypothetical protein
MSIAIVLLRSSLSGGASRTEKAVTFKDFSDIPSLVTKKTDCKKSYLLSYLILSFSLVTGLTPHMKLVSHR